MKYLDNTKVLCLEYAEYICLCTEVTYWHQRSRNEITTHGNGDNALIEFESLPPRYREKVKAKYGDPYKHAARQPLLELVTFDQDARRFYADEYQCEDGTSLSLKLQGIYSRQCDWLNMIKIMTADAAMLKQMLNIPVLAFWKEVIELYQTDKIEHRLPRSERRLRERMRRYKEDGYGGLVDGRLMNSNSRKVTSKIENLFVALSARRHGRASQVQILQDYNEFIAGKISPVDLITGEVFNPSDFTVDGSIYQVKLATVNYYVNKKANRELIDMVKLGGHDYVQKHKPHNRRHSAQFSFSTITADDYLPPFKTLDGRRTVWMYVFFDVASTACNQ